MCRNDLRDDESRPPESVPRTACVAVSTTDRDWRSVQTPPGRRGPPHQFREGVSEAVATPHTSADPRPLVPVPEHDRRADGTPRARTPKVAPGASPLSLRDERDVRYRRIAHEPGVASPDPVRRARRRPGHGTGPLSRPGILALQRGVDLDRYSRIGACLSWRTVSGFDRTERRSPLENSSRRRLVNSTPQGRGGPGRCRPGAWHPR